MSYIAGHERLTLNSRSVERPWGGGDERVCAQQDGRSQRLIATARRTQQG
jgi:hypothetical protein